MDEETQLQLALSLSKEEHQQVECPRGWEALKHLVWTFETDSKKNCNNIILNKSIVKMKAPDRHTGHIYVNWSAKALSQPSFLYILHQRSQMFLEPILNYIF